ncbi:DUF3180 domain-containing protein [Microbacterium sp. Gd 4-13]|uniref:DUF3180 domain-containing protein n=1 Tax=Microbacterium sp. Gd 4-13 TaxID=2173179 RepID=UPI000D586090|nr:DUF3180 domain-containing protein [Microbacterium sp. Gd 4-13]PVW05457.1 DUF3180 domain-containing protein [Microbacterium sp. Gd 4-13]
MKRTGAGVLVGAAILGIVVGFVLDTALSSAGRPTFAPAVTLPILLLLVGGAVIALAIPIRRATRGLATTAVNPFRALRIAILAKASSIVGAAIGGVAVGLLLFLFTRPVTPSVGSMGTTIATVICGGILVAAALVAEHLCTIRKDDDDEQPGGDSAGVAH